jgi:hypothetical protein
MALRAALCRGRYGRRTRRWSRYVAVLKAPMIQIGAAASKTA